MKRTRSLIAMSLLVTLVLLPGATSPAPVQGEEASPFSLYPIALVCPNLVDLKWDPDSITIPPGCTFDRYTVERDPPPPGKTNPIFQSYNRTDDFYRDEEVETGQTYTYSLGYWYQCPPGDAHSSTVLSRPVRVLDGPYQVTVGEACSGYLYRDLTFGTGVHGVHWLEVKEDAVLRIGGGAQVARAYEGSIGQIVCSGEQAQLQIDGAEFMTVTVSFPAGQGWVRDAHFASGGVRLSSEVKGIPVIGNSFTGGFHPLDPQFSWNKIALEDNSSALIKGNQGQFGVSLHNKSRATIQDNIFEGLVSLEEESEARIENNHITGEVRVNGYGASPGLEATATLVSNTIVLTDTTLFTYLYALRACQNGHLTAIRSHLENRRSNCTITPWYCSMARADTGADITVQKSWILGQVTAHDDAEIDLCDNKLIRGRIHMEDESVGHVVRNQIEGEARLYESTVLTFTDNVMSSRISIEGEAKGEFQRNTFKGSSYAFDVSGGQPHPHPDLTIKHNCIESGAGLVVRASRPTTLTVRDNWWGHESGPEHRQNPEGPGAYIDGDNVDFEPYLKSPIYDGRSLCRDTPPPPPCLPVVASAVIGPQGGMLYTPDDSARVDVPPNALAQETQVTFAQRCSSPTDDLSSAPFFDPATVIWATSPSPTGGLLSVRFFDLSAVISGTTTPVTALNKPYTLTINYTDAERGAAIESTLGLYWWDESGWVWEPTSSVYPREDRLTATPDHMTLFVVLGETNRVYLPLVLCNQ